MSDDGSRWRRENALLCAAARVTPGATPGMDAPGIRDWDYLLRAADQHGILPLLHQRVQTDQTIAPPQEVAARLSGAYWANHFRNRVLLHSLTEVLREAATEGISVMPLKGAALALLYYDAPALRPMSDLDLLVQPGDVAAMTGMLRRLGYVEIPGSFMLLDERFRETEWEERRFVVHRSGCDVLIEFRIEPLDPLVETLSALDPALAAALHDRAALMWARSCPATYEGAPFMRMSPEDLLLHVASHLITRHRYLRLLWLRDLALVVAAHDDIDWAYLGDAARQLRLAISVHAAFAAAEQMLGVAIPFTALERSLFAGGEGRKPLQRAERTFFARRLRAIDGSDLSASSYAPIWLVAASFGRLRGWKPRLRALRWIIFPSREYLAAWGNKPIPARRTAYIATFLRFGGVSLLRALGGACRVARVPVLPALIDRFMGRVRPFGAE